MKEENFRQLAELPTEIWLRIIKFSPDVYTTRKITTFKPDLFNLVKGQAGAILCPNEEPSDTITDLDIEVPFFEDLQHHQKLARSCASDQNQITLSRSKIQLWEIAGSLDQFKELTDSCFRAENINAVIFHTGHEVKMDDVIAQDELIEGVRSNELRPYVLFPMLNRWYINFQNYEYDQIFTFCNISDTLFPVLSFLEFCGIKMSEETSNELNLIGCSFPCLKTLHIIDFEICRITDCDFKGLKNLKLHFPESPEDQNDRIFAIDQFNSYLQETYVIDEESIKSLLNFKPKLKTATIPLCVPQLETLSLMLPLINHDFIQNPLFLDLISTDSVPFDNLRELSLALCTCSTEFTQQYDLFDRQNMYTPLELIGMLHLILSFISDCLDHCGEKMEILNFEIFGWDTGYYISKRLVNTLTKMTNLKKLKWYNISFNDKVEDENLLRDEFVFDKLLEAHLVYTGIYSDDDFIPLKCKSLDSLKLRVKESYNGAMNNLPYSEYFQTLSKNCPNVTKLGISHSRDLNTRPRKTSSNDPPISIPRFPISTMVTNWNNVEELDLVLNVLDIVQLFTDSSSKKISIPSCKNFTIRARETSFENFMLKDTIILQMIDQSTGPSLEMDAPLLKRLGLHLSYANWGPPRLSDSGHFSGMNELTHDWTYEELPLYYQKVMDWFQTIKLGYYEELEKVVCSQHNLMFKDLRIDRRNYGIKCYLSSSINDEEDIVVGHEIESQDGCISMRTYSGASDDE